MIGRVRPCSPVFAASNRQWSSGVTRNEIRGLGQASRLGQLVLLSTLRNCFMAGERTLFFLWMAASGR